MGRKGGVLGRHTYVCHGAQPRWETAGGHRRRHQRLHGYHHQPGHGALPSGLGRLRFPEGHGRRRGRHDPHAPPTPAQGGHLPGQRAPPAVVPAGKRLGPRHGNPQVVGSDHLQVRLALPGLLSAAGHATMPTPYSHTEGRLESAALGRCGCRRARGRQDQWGRHARSLPGCCYWG